MVNSYQPEQPVPEQVTKRVKTENSQLHQEKPVQNILLHLRHYIETHDGPRLLIVFLPPAGADVTPTIIDEGQTLRLSFIIGNTIKVERVRSALGEDFDNAEEIFDYAKVAFGASKKVYERSYDIPLKCTVSTFERDCKMSRFKTGDHKEELYVLLRPYVSLPKLESL